MDTPDGETTGDRPENVDRGDVGGDPDVSPLPTAGMSRLELLFCGWLSLLLF